MPIKIVLGTLALIVLWLILRELRRVPAKLHVLMFTAFLDMAGTLMVIPLMPFYAARLGAGGLVVGVLVSSFAIAQLVSAPMWGRFSDKFGRRPTLMVAMGASALAYLIFGYSNTIFLLFLSRIVQGAGGGSCKDAGLAVRRNKSWCGTRTGTRRVGSGRRKKTNRLWSGQRHAGTCGTWRVRSDPLRPQPDLRVDLPS